MALVVLALPACDSADSGTRSAHGDEPLSRGAALWARCRTCHQIGPRARHVSGPQLNQLIGRRVGASPGFRYSEALSGSGEVWTRELLDQWLASPYKLFRGTSMNFGGISDPADREALIDYLIERGDQSAESL
ncbi:MAG: cytochrome c family protein [Pseudomonadota bacterium]